MKPTPEPAAVRLLHQVALQRVRGPGDETISEMG